jgi:hypothetical protein
MERPEQYEELASDFQSEARQRPYVKALIPDLCENKNFWDLVLEIVQIVLRKRGYLIVRRSAVEGAITVPPSEKTEAGR